MARFSHLVTIIYFHKTVKNNQTMVTQEEPQGFVNLPAGSLLFMAGQLVKEWIVTRTTGVFIGSLKEEFRTLSMRHCPTASRPQARHTTNDFYVFWQTCWLLLVSLKLSTILYCSYELLWMTAYTVTKYLIRLGGGRSENSFYVVNRPN